MQLEYYVWRQHEMLMAGFLHGSKDIELEYRHELRPLYRTRRDTTDPVSILSTIGADKNPFTLPNDLGQAGSGRELGSFRKKLGSF